ncbi:MATE family efflux transporter [Aureimonas glaciei]|jgi:MATE family multidrug resistance protein|uniref:Multidrug-efflux transporter n=1 Tax=Aureimonas glaciei TaxID=1776957 RepID=A0A916V2K1_9HYPH|nr:MATE family efflux transporter [Aureimonas glaciei]GGD02366.1 MATE family efflux transporter [Aureimonas glaciei]
MDAPRSPDSRLPPAPLTSSWSGHLGAMLRLGLPLAGVQLAQMSINVTDTVMIGWLGPKPLAAAVLATQAFFLFWMFGSGFAQAVMPVAAHAAGRGDVRGVRRSVRMGLWVILAYGALAMVPLWNLEAILLALGQDAEVAALAGAFTHVLQWSMFPALVIAGLRSYLSVLDRAHIVLGVTLFGALVNALGDYALIFGHFGLPALGMQGAAVASVVTNLAMCAILFAYTALSPQLKPYELYVRFWRPDWPAFFDVLRLGWPISTTIIAEVGLFAAASIMMGWLGAIALAAHGIALQLASIAFMVPLGLSNAATVRVGRAHGAQDWRGLGRAAHTGLALAVAIAVLGALLFFVAPTGLIGLYLDGRDPDAAAVLAIGVPLLAVAAAFQVFDAVQVMAAGLLRGIRDTRVPMLMAVFSYWAVGMPVAYVLGFVFDFGGPGVWAGLASGLFLAALLMTQRFHRRVALGLTAG